MILKLPCPLLVAGAMESGRHSLSGREGSLNLIGEKWREWDRFAYIYICVCVFLALIHNKESLLPRVNTSDRPRKEIVSRRGILAYLLVHLHV